MNRLLLMLQVSNLNMAKIMVLVNESKDDWSPAKATELGQLVRENIQATALELGSLPDIGSDPTLN